MASELQQRIERRERETALFRFFPDAGPLRREFYPKHIAFMAAGGTFQERAFIAANRVGKTMTAAYEVTCHMMGWYPDWWVGRKFDRPVSVWACGEDTKAVRESLQETLLGKPEAQGTGMIPAASLLRSTARPGVPEAVDAVHVRHSKGISRAVFKTYDQGRESYQGAKVDVVWFDEEPPMAIYSEGLTRTMATVPGDENGLVICTFTPLKGMSDVVMAYLPSGVTA